MIRIITVILIRFDLHKVSKIQKEQKNDQISQNYMESNISYIGSLCLLGRSVLGLYPI